jgi:hypothetical protein
MKIYRVSEYLNTHKKIFVQKNESVLLVNDKRPLRVLCFSVGFAANTYDEEGKNLYNGFCGDITDSTKNSVCGFTQALAKLIIVKSIRDYEFGFCVTSND